MKAKNLILKILSAVVKYAATGITVNGRCPLLLYEEGAAS